MKKTLALLICVITLPLAVCAQDKSDDFGIWTSVGVEKKINKKLSVGIEGEFRTRNSAKTVDRWTGSINADYKLLPWLKIGAGYKFIYNNRIEKITYNSDGSYNNWRPSYWTPRHRFNVDLTGTLKINQFSLSLRERWQYTYRPEKTTTRYDFDNEWWEDTDVSSKHSHVLRSRFQVKYDILNCPITPFANVELYNNWSLDKVRYTLGADWKITKQHEISAFYRYQKENSDEEFNKHVLGIGYKFKF